MKAAEFRVAPSMPARSAQVSEVVETEADALVESVESVGSRVTRHELIAIAVVEGAIERYRSSLSRRNRRDDAAIERKVRELRRLVTNAHREIAQLSLTTPDDIAPLALECVDELQEGCRGAFIPLSRGEAKMVVLSILNDMGVELSAEEIKTISTHDADEDLIAFVRDDKMKRRIGSAAWGVICGVVTFIVLVISPYVFDYSSFLPQLEIRQPAPQESVSESRE